MGQELAGIVFPDHGDSIFREDWVKEQEEKSKEIIQRDLDTQGAGIETGGAITAGTGSTVNLEACICYNSDGQRISAPATPGIAVASGTYKIALRHVFTETEYYAPENSIKAVVHRDNSYEIVLRPGAYESRDVHLAEVTSDGSTITGITDDREWRIRRLRRDMNLSDVASVATARTNMDVYSKSEGDGRYTQRENNLSDVASVATARTNLDIYSKSEIFNLLYPVGTIYTRETAEMGTPASMGWPGVWDDVSADPYFADRSPRVTGSLAGSAFTTQEDAFQGHWHSQYHAPVGATTTGPNGYLLGSANDNISNATQQVANRYPIPDGTNGTPRTATETRVKSFIVQKFKRVS